MYMSQLAEYLIDIILCVALLATIGFVAGQLHAIYLA